MRSKKLSTKRYLYNPDYAVAPGSVLQERLEAQKISQAEFARRCGRSAKLISEIISGKAPLEPETALQFEKVLGVDASIWLGIEARYQLHCARKNEAEDASKQADWVNAFPVKELVKREYFQKPASDADAMFKLLTFFGVASVQAWTDRYESLIQKYELYTTLVTLLRLGELEAEQQESAEFDKKKLKETTQELKNWEFKLIKSDFQQAAYQFNQSGVVFTFVQPLPGIKPKGAAWWMNSKKPVILICDQQNLEDEHWDSFLSEATQTLLQSKKSVFVDDGTGYRKKLEA
jgi:addiction module HigA family antidote